MQTPPDKFFAAFEGHYPITGQQLITLSQADGVAMGLNIGEAFYLAQQLFLFFFQDYHSPPFDTYATWSPAGPDWAIDSFNLVFLRSKVMNNPIDISTTVVLEALIGIDEVNFFFEIQFLLVMSWKDERINTRCVGAGANGARIQTDDRCGQYWQPTMPPIFPNVVSIDGNPSIEVLEDLGLFTVPGRYRTDCTLAPCPSIVNTSVGYRMMRLRGTFGAAMEFRRMPCRPC